MFPKDFLIICPSGEISPNLVTLPCTYQKYFIRNNLKTLRERSTREREGVKNKLISRLNYCYCTVQVKLLSSDKIHFF